jgi:ERF superfamily
MSALLAVQKEAPKLQKDGVNPHFKNKYVPLDSLMEAITPVLTGHGLVWITLPCRDEQGEPALRYRLVHVESGEEITETMPLLLKAEDPQGQGSAITYARRYSLMALLGLVANDDDDGKAASRSTVARGRIGPTGGGTVSAPAAQATERLATAKQRGLINARCAEKGLPPTTLADIVVAASGVDAREWGSQSDAEGWLKRALDRLPARLVDPIVEGIGNAPSEIEA